MSEKFLLSDEELSSVVGGFAGEQNAGTAFDTAARHFNDLYDELFFDLESKSVVQQMLQACVMARRQRITETKANSEINTLEGYYSALVSLNAQAAATARSILDTLKTDLGL